MNHNSLTPTFQESPVVLSHLSTSKDHDHQGLRSLEPLELSTTSRSRADYDFPEGGFRAWLVVFGSFCVIFGTYGLLSSVGLFLAYWKVHQLASYSSGSIGWISAVNVFLTLGMGVQVGPLFDKHGPRWLIAGGSVIYVVSLVVMAECTKYWHFMVMYGIFSGVANACLTTTALAVIAHWFEIRRGMASGITFVGSSVGGIVFPMVLKPVLESLGWKWSMRIVALIVGICMIIGNVCIRGRLPPKTAGGSINLHCFGDARFSWASVGISCGYCTNITRYTHLMTATGFEFVLFGILGVLPTYALGQGFSTQTTFNIIAIMNAYDPILSFSSSLLTFTVVLALVEPFRVGCQIVTGVSIP